MAVVVPFAVALVALAGCMGAVSRAHTVHVAAPRAALAPVRDEDWPMFRDDVERSGFAEGSTVGASVVELWRIPAFNTTAYGAAKGSASIVGDTLYCGTDTGRFVAVRIRDGTVLWQLQIPNTTHGIHGSPAIVGDTVYIGAYDGALYAIDRRTGVVKWRHQVGDQIGSSPAVVPEWGLVFVAHEVLPTGGFVVAVDARTGEEVWRQAIEAHAHSSVAIDVGRHAVFVGDNHGWVYRFDARDGTVVWRRRIEAPDGRVQVKTTPMLAADLSLVIFGSWAGRVHALDEETGRTLWEVPIGGRIMASAAYLPALHRVFVAQPGGYVYALDAATGALAWVFHAGGSLYGSPAVSGDGRAVVFGAGDGRVYAVGAKDGLVLWSIFVGGRVTGSPSLVGDRVYVTADHGALVALRTFEPTVT